MNDCEYDFLNLLSDVDEQLICEAGEMRQTHPDKKSNLSRGLKAACAALLILAGSMAVFHTEVEATFRKAVTLIGEMLGIEKDISSFTDVKGIPISRNGLTLTLEEVVLDKNQLFILVSQRFESIDAEADTALLQDVKLNGVPLETLNEYSTDAALDGPIHKYLLNYYLEDSVVTEGSMEIDALFTVKNADDGNEIGKYRFTFQTTAEELEKETVRIPMEQKIVIAEDSELKLSEITVNCIESTIVGSCDDLPLGAEYYLKGCDDCGNQVIYRLLSYENPKAVFVKETDCHIASDAEKLELQLYRHSMGEPDSVSEEEEFIVGGSIDDDVLEMEPVGDSFTVNIRKNETGKNPKAEEKIDSSEPTVVSIIGGADEPTEIFLEGNTGRTGNATDFDLRSPDESQVIRDESGKIIGVEESAFYSVKKYEDVSAEELSEREQFLEYEDFGITYHAENREIQFAGKRVVQLEDEYWEGSVLQFVDLADYELSPDDTLVWLTAVRDEEDKLLFFTYSDSNSLLPGMSFDDSDWIEDGEVIDATMDGVDTEDLTS